MTGVLTGNVVNVGLRKNKGILIIIIIYILSRSFGLSLAAKPDSFFLAVAGKTKEELLTSGEFVQESSFGNRSERSAPEMSNVFASAPKQRISDTVSVNARFFPIIPNVSKDVSSVMFYLFTHENPTIGHPLSESARDSFFTSSWHLNEPVKVLVHGYKGSCDRDSFANQLIAAYLSNKRVLNVVCMDWKRLADEEDYYESARHIHKVAERLAEFLSFLKRSGYVRTYDSMHVIGFSLGAQLVGVVGNLIVQKKEESILGRITGLDPAGPGFMKVPPENRLDSTDAAFVDAIHTNMGSLKQGYLGTTAVCGHADFYPNGGSFQPSCGSSIVGDIISTCSHHESIMLFVKSVKGTKFPSCKCKDWVSFLTGECGDCRRGPLMGEAASKEKTMGSFYLRT